MPPRRKAPTCDFCSNPSTTTMGAGVPVCATCESVARQVVRDKLDAVYAAIQKDIDAYFAAQKEGKAA